MRCSIPFLKRDRLDRLSKSRDPVIQNKITNSPTFSREYENCLKPPIKVDGQEVESKMAAKQAYALSLHRSADGYGLELSAAVPFVHLWVNDGTSLLSGASFIHAIQIRGSTVATGKRAARGRPLAEGKCDACGRTETLGHILQVCHRTWGSRIKLHDSLVEKLLHDMEHRGWSIVIIPVRGGTPQIPDGVLYKQDTCWVIDASVVADNADLDEAHISKCAKYNTPAVRDWCQSNWPSQGEPGAVSFGALIFNWRGVMAPRSASMCHKLGISKSRMKVYAVGVVEWGWYIFRAFHKGTERWY